MTPAALLSADMKMSCHSPSTALVKSNYCEIYLTNNIWLSAFLIELCAIGRAADLRRRKSFEQAVAIDGIRSAYLKYLADDSVVFRPEPVNGKQFWNARADGAGAILVRDPLFADIAANGMMGYITGSWELYPKGKQARDQNSANM